MIKKTKIFLALLLISSCSVISYSQVFPLMKNSIFGAPDQKITTEVYNDFEYSFIKVRYGRAGVAILSLASIDNDVFKWVSQSNEILYTYKGKIIKAENSFFDFSVHNYHEFNLDSQNQLIYSFILENPYAFVEHSVSITGKVSSDLINEVWNSPIFYQEEIIKTSGFKWNFVNKYWTDSKENVVKSIQYVHPKAKKLDIEFYYKF